MTSTNALVAALTVAMSGSAVGCRKAAPTSAGAGPSASASASGAPPLDHLAEGELAIGTEKVFGLPLPRGLKLIGVFPGEAHAAGPLPIEDVSNFVRDRVDVRRVELGAAGAVFPAVHITGGDPSRLYRIVVSVADPGTRLTVEDITPKPKPPADNVPEAERWRRAGYNRDGTLIDPKSYK